MTTNKDKMRYRVMDESVSAHCCFRATVVDTTKPAMTAEYRERYGPHYESICETFELELAVMIAASLNGCSEGEVIIQFEGREGTINDR